MRKNIVAGNWKMNTTVPEGVQLAKDVCAAVAAEANLKCDVIMGVPFTHLMAVKEVIGDANVGLAAQNCADHTSGAYTGEVSAAMVASTGANYVILGHSERRGYYNESYEMLKTKVDLALENGLKVIFCCGESLEERENAMSPSGPSVPARPPRATRHRRSTPSSVACWLTSMAHRWPTTPPSSTAVAASPATPPNCSPSPTSTAASSAAPHSRPATSWASSPPSKRLPTQLSLVQLVGKSNWTIFSRYKLRFSNKAF